MRAKFIGSSLATGTFGAVRTRKQQVEDTQALMARLDGGLPLDAAPAEEELDEMIKALQQELTRLLKIKKGENPRRKK